ncbi:hypothetical protein JKA74_01065 [Marivirga sp. S37H4]|uniref:STAS domain-containing protein n=1 Tax=Marivirga aurantiaca TaxID=2802615 RepID=A0A935C694_9BACT|nr:hypothetical protein [Marivirga aurantiaca]MBK6263607.1 hypothetical protein [Marivirga aurantiaca]
MKKYYSTSEYKKANKRRAVKSHKRKLVSKEKKKKKLRDKQGKSVEQLKKEDLLKRYIKISAPNKFSFIKYPEETIKFIHKLERQYQNRKKVFVDLSLIEELDYSAISILVSVMFTFKSRNIDFNGSFPENPDLKKLLIDSDFFKYLNRPVGNKLEYNVGKPNQIFTRANKEVNSELGLVVMEEVSETIWGKKRTCKGLQRVLLELMHNTNNHADTGGKGVKHWWLSVNHNKKEQKVSFVFIDYGVGIFESLKNKPNNSKWAGAIEKISNRFKYGSNNDILKLLLNGDVHMTVTGEHFRGKGLPGIKEVQDRNQISNLHIISNDVFSDVENDNYKKLNKNFSGTFAFWELNKDNINSEWIIS